MLQITKCLVSLCILSMAFSSSLININKIKSLKSGISYAIGLGIAFSNGINIEKVNAMIINDEESITRLVKGKEQLQILDKNWDSIAKKGGDEIRRYLGTVYGPSLPKSPLSSMPLFMEKFIKSHANDINLSEFEEPTAEFLESLTQADFLAYSANFAEFSGSAGLANSPNGPTQLLIKSHNAVQKAEKSLTEMLKIINEASE